MRTSKTFLVALLAFLSVGLAACNGPTGPTGISGVTINGSIVPASASAAMGGPAAARPALSTIPPGMTVSVEGTAVTTQVSASGNFVLLQVPPGNAGLRFSAPGVLAVAALNGLVSGQTVEVTVTVTETTAEIESDRRSLGREEQLEGRVEALPPIAAVGSLVVAGRVVLVSPVTTYLLHGVASSFNALEVGQRVHVKGQNAGSLLARSIEIQNTNTSIVVPLNGTISNFNGTSSAFEFTVSGRLVKGDAATVFFGNSRFSDLVNGARVEVKGAERNGFVYATRLKVN